MIIISVSMVTTIYCLKLHHTVGREAQAMPSYVRYVLLDLLPIVLFLHPPPDPPSEDSESLLKDEERILTSRDLKVTLSDKRSRRFESANRKRDSHRIQSLLIFIKNWNIFLIEWEMKIVRDHMKTNGNMLLWFWTGLTFNDLWMTPWPQMTCYFRACAWIFLGGLSVSFFATVCSAPGIFSEEPEVPAMHWPEVKWCQPEVIHQPDRLNSLC